MPKLGSQREFKHADSLGDLVSSFDVFVFDSFGVLNVGDAPIDGAAECLEDLRKEGKQVFVLTNAATTPIAELTMKYAKLGFEFSASEIISSRQVLSANLSNYPGHWSWAIALADHHLPGELGVPFQLINLQNDEWRSCDAMILMSSRTIGDAVFTAIRDELVRHPRPVLIGNPDLASPWESAFNIEPGEYAHRLTDQLGLEPVFFGKPYANAFDELFSRLPAKFDRRRAVMIGDTLHTDILGGAAAGMSTILVTGYGVLKSLEINDCIQTSGICPDFVIPSI
ncbi:MAG: HAD-IIA family hydrolase [Pseudomonadota bacterium]